ncbi:hypothetical protein [Salipiger sp. PrR002]|uniref:hypothetical protein n=1 Tax=Salipiger sp. PrR002 TaxID=2706489 RepID=UPI0013B7DA58|nr:hypothetical protein [Salipiger sp. PrR002]NDW00234.1 hypothetical protein [Salipiger sp. PrR002]NDW58628.1 hypothetical protein [Salipiger sp. PrR004]
MFPYETDDPYMLVRDPELTAEQAAEKIQALADDLAGSHQLAAEQAVERRKVFWSETGRHHFLSRGPELTAE